MDLNLSDDDSQSDQNAEPNTTPSSQNDMRMLKYSWDDIITSDEFKCLLKPLNSKVEQQNTIGLLGIKKKFDTYTGLVQFMDDIVSVCHSYKAHFPKDANVRNAVDSLLEKCQRDVKSISTCNDCFEYWIIDSDNYFTRVCKKPHLLVFAKLSGHPMWPAKVMSIDDDMVNVEFFGDHTQEDILFEDCFLFSKELMAKAPRNNRDLGKALKELKVHIQNVEKEFGAINPAVGKVAINGDDLAQEIKNMFPGAFKKAKTVAKGSKRGSSSDDAQEIFDSSDDEDASVVQGEDDHHDETFSQSQNKKPDDTMTQEDDGDTTQDETRDELVIDETETSADESHRDSTTKEEAEEKPKDDETSQESGDESDKEANEDQHEETRKLDQSDDSAVEAQKKHDDQPESESDTDFEGSEINGKRKPSESDTDSAPNKRTRLTIEMNSQLLDTDETDDDMQIVSVSQPTQSERKLLAQSTGNATAAKRNDSSSKEARTAQLKEEISYFEDKKSTAVNTMVELKEAKAQCKKNIDEYNEKIRILKQRIAIIEHEPACYVCNTAISGRKYFCSDDCENNRSERGQ